MGSFFNPGMVLRHSTARRFLRPKLHALLPLSLPEKSPGDSRVGPPSQTSSGPHLRGSLLRYISILFPRISTPSLPSSVKTISEPFQSEKWKRQRQHDRWYYPNFCLKTTQRRKLGRKGVIKNCDTTRSIKLKVKIKMKNCGDHIIFFSFFFVEWRRGMCGARRSPYD